MKLVHSDGPHQGQVSGQTTETEAASRRGGTRRVARSTEGKNRAARADGKLAATGRDERGKSDPDKARVVRTLIAEDRKTPPAQASVMQGHGSNRSHPRKEGGPPRTKR